MQSKNRREIKNKQQKKTLLEGKELHANYPISPESKILEFPFVLLWPGPQGVIRKTSINSKHDTLCHPVEIPIQTCTTSCNTFFEVSHYVIYPAWPRFAQEQTGSWHTVVWLQAQFLGIRPRSLVPLNTSKPCQHLQIICILTKVICFNLFPLGWPATTARSVPLKSYSC